MGVLDGVDVVMLQESFSRRGRARLLRGFGALGFIHSTGVPGSSWFSGLRRQHTPRVALINSGVLVLSKHPIAAEASLVYDRAWNEDALAAKGAVAADIAHPRLGVFTVATTHLQASGPDEFRTEQVVQLAAFLAGRQPPGRPLFVGGDLNTCVFAAPDVYATWASALGCALPRIVRGAGCDGDEDVAGDGGTLAHVRFTDHGETNDLLQRRGSDVAKWLDVILTRNVEGATLVGVRVRDPAGYSMPTEVGPGWFGLKTYGDPTVQHDLSDHHCVLLTARIPRQGGP